MRARRSWPGAWLCAALLASSAALAQPTVDAEIDSLLRQGYDAPDAAVAGLRQVRCAPIQPSCGAKPCSPPAWCWHRAAATPKRPP